MNIAVLYYISHYQVNTYVLVIWVIWRGCLLPRLGVATEIQIGFEG